MPLPAGLLAAISQQRFKPTSLAGCVLWCPNSAIVTAATWKDASGNAANLVGAGGTQNPNVVTNVINGLSVLRFAKASNQFMTSALGSWPGGNQSHTMFVVGRFTALTSAFEGLFSCGSSNTGAGSSVIGMDNNQKFWFGGSNDVASSDGNADTSFHVFAKTFDGSTVKGYLDGVQVTTQNSKTYTMTTQMQLGGYAGLTGNADCDAAEVVAINRLITTAEFTLINEYLGNKFALIEP